MSVDREIRERLAQVDAAVAAIKRRQARGESVAAELEATARELRELVEDAEAVGVDLRPSLTPEDRREAFALQARLARLQKGAGR